MEHTKDCNWEKSNCEYKATHHYCPHEEHKCDCKKPNTNLNFGQALELLKRGKNIKRASWGGHWSFYKNPHCEQVLENNYISSFSFNNGLIVATLKDMGGCAPAMPYQADLLAEDWEEVA